SVGAVVVGSQDDARGAPQDHQVQQRGPVLDVIEVQTHRLVPGEITAAVDLPHAGHAGLDQQTAPGVGAVGGDLAGQRRARPDQAHLTAHDVEQLGQLVEAV